MLEKKTQGLLERPFVRGTNIEILVPEMLAEKTQGLLERLFGRGTTVT